MIGFFFFFIFIVSAGLDSLLVFCLDDEEFSSASSDSSASCDVCERDLLRLERGHRDVQITSRPPMLKLEVASHEST